MALTTEEKDRLAQSGIAVPEVRTMVRHFLAISGYSQVEFGEAIGYSHTAINLFLNGRYNAHHPAASNEFRIASMSKDFIEQHPLQIEEQQQNQLYETSSYKEMRRAFYRALDNGFAYCVDGDPGTEKTFVLKHLVRELITADAHKNGHGRRAFYVRARIKIRPLSLLKRIAMAAGIPDGGTIDQLIRKILFHYSTRRALLVLDEAQLLDIDCLETLRELLDEPPYFGLIFAGSHDVQARFMSVVMEQWRSRVKKTIVLEGVERGTAEHIITDQLGRTSKAAIDQLVADATVMSSRRRDPSSNQPLTYISARILFDSIRMIKEGKKVRA